MNDAAEDSQKKEKKENTRWTVKQDLKYKLFLILHADSMGANKKKTRIFKEMILFTCKDEQKNRTHHDKMIKKFKKFKDPQKHLLYQFYYDYYYMRRLDEVHLKKELRLFISQSAADEEDKEGMVKKAYKNVALMNFHANCLKYRQAYESNNQMLSNESLEPIYSQQSSSPVGEEEILVPRQPPEIVSSPEFLQEHSLTLFNIWNLQNEQFNGVQAPYMNIYERQFL